MEQTTLIVTGYSGAGKTTVLKALEDLGFFCVDNLPLPLLPAFFEYVRNSTHCSIHKRIALGIDVRAGTHIEELLELINQDEHLILFLTTATGELIKRFQETRRKHPLANGNSTIIEAIDQEKLLLQPLLASAELVVDTGNFNMHQLRAFVHAAFSRDDTPQTMVVSLTSFGFKYGVPQECNYVYDVRSLPNPYFVPRLRHLTGKDPLIRSFLFAEPTVQEYWNRLHDFCTFAIKKSQEEGRFFMQIAIGCTGGKHRSVTLVEELAKQKLDAVTFLVAHRDIGRE